MNFKLLLNDDPIAVGVNYIRIEYLQPLGISGEQNSRTARDDQGEAATPKGITVFKSSIQGRMKRLIDLDQKCDPDGVSRGYKHAFWDSL